ncbi:hypothetical protein MAIT1_03916 [Magnetofaba australis IT-1]|uniref:Uncharacterized protein n=1 Tax=Magnetofaba australis IT-1 TaxID=1434232 RepID=A0A1Y2KB60_9PROT|nr:hypothetical protein MAIT1_03916 [Magnetofaba australis IT-1]
MEAMFEPVYHVPTKPVELAYIGFEWSDKMGPVKGPGWRPVSTESLRSLSDLHNKTADRAILALGGMPSLVPVKAGVALGGSNKREAIAQGLRIIRPRALWEIRFEPKRQYVTEALYLENFELSHKTNTKIGVGAQGTVPGTEALGSVSAMGAIGAEGGGDAGTAGQGLALAYKVQEIDTYSLEEKPDVVASLSDGQPHELIPDKLEISLKFQDVLNLPTRQWPDSQQWACLQGRQMADRINQAWLLTLRKRDADGVWRSRVTALPPTRMASDCQHVVTFDGYIDSQDGRIHRNKLVVALDNADLDHHMRPSAGFQATATFKQSSFTLKDVAPPTPVITTDLRHEP